MSQRFFWQLYSSKGRQQSLELLKTDLSSVKADLVDFKAFSDVQLSCIVEIKEIKLGKLHSKLVNWAEISGAKGLGQLCSPREAVLYLSLNFAKGDGALQQDIPQVPG